MIVKMKFLSISGPRLDIDRVCDKYLSKYEMQLENAVTELKTTDNLLPFVEVNPYKDALAKAEQFAALLPEGSSKMDQSMSKEDMLTFIRELNHDYLKLQEKKELLSKKENNVREKLNVLEPFSPLELDLYKTARYKYMKVRFGRINVDYYKKLEKYLFDDLQAVFLEGIRNENYVYGCYFVANADMSKVDSAFNSLHFERISIPAEYVGTPKDACLRSPSPLRRHKPPCRCQAAQAYPLSAIAWSFRHRLHRLWPSPPRDAPPGRCRGAPPACHTVSLCPLRKSRFY